MTFTTETHFDQILIGILICAAETENNPNALIISIGFVFLSFNIIFE